MKNRAHTEPLKDRIKRFQDRDSVEVIETLLNSIDNFFNNEIRITTESNHYQTSLLFLGIHAVALTISENFFNKRGVEGYKIFLEKFVDGDKPDIKFSRIAKDIHNWRNIIAHKWLNIKGYGIEYDYTSKYGWEKRSGIIFINPRIYRKQYLSAFGVNGRIWNYKEIFTKEELNQIKNRLLLNFLS